MVTQQPLFFVTDDTISNTGAEYLQINARHDYSYASLAIAQMPIATGGKFKQINIKVNNAPGASASYEFALMVNGSPSGTLIDSISGASATTLTITADHSISAQDTVAIRITPSGTPTQFTRLDGNIIWEPTTDDEYLILGGTSNTLDPTSTEYCYPEAANGGTWNSNAGLRRQLIPAAGQLTKFACDLSASPGAAPDKYDITVMTDNSGSQADTNLTLELNAADFTKVISPTAANVAAGNLVQMKSVPTDTPTAVYAKWSIVFVPTTTGEIPILGGVGDAPDNTGIEFNNYGAAMLWYGTRSQSDMEIYGIDITVKAVYHYITAAPGSTKSWTFETEKNGTSEADLSVTITDPATTGNKVDKSITFSSGDKISLESNPSGTPTAAYERGGIVFTYGTAAITRSFCPGVIG